MKKTKQKFNRVQPLIKNKKDELNVESKKLFDLKEEKLEYLKVLKSYEQKYLQGVKKVNEAKHRGDLSTVQILEPSVIHMKDQWADTLLSIKELERKEMIQRDIVLESTKSLKSFEKLAENYQKTLKGLQKKKEQSELDEFSVVTFKSDDLEDELGLDD